MKFENFAPLLNNIKNSNLSEDIIIMEMNGYFYPIWNNNLIIKKLFKNSVTGKKTLEEKNIFGDNSIIDNDLTKLNDMIYIYSDYEIYFRIPLIQSADIKLNDNTHDHITYNISNSKFIEYKFKDEDINNIIFKIISVSKESFIQKELKMLKEIYVNNNNTQVLSFFRNGMCLGMTSIVNEDDDFIPFILLIDKTEIWDSFIYDYNFYKFGKFYDIEKIGEPNGIKKISENEFEFYDSDMNKITAKIEKISNSKFIFENYLI